MNRRYGIIGAGWVRAIVSNGTAFQIIVDGRGKDKGEDIELRRPPITEMASGWSICEPAPMPKARGNMPATVASAVMVMGRRRRRPAWIHGVVERHAGIAEMGFGVKRGGCRFWRRRRMTMIMPIKEATLKVVRVIKSATKPPNVERIAEERIAVGAEKVRNSKSSTAKKQKKRKEREL